MTTVHEITTPSVDDAKIAEASSRKLASLLNEQKSGMIVRIADARGKAFGESITLPQGAVKLLVEALAEMGKGNAVELTAIPAQLTTQEAANVIGVSRPFLVKEIEEGRLACQRVGTHRRIFLTDLMAYKHSMSVARHKALDELVKQAQELNMGY